jgi:hypothetical protein
MDGGAPFNFFCRGNTNDTDNTNVTDMSCGRWVVALVCGV